MDEERSKPTQKVRQEFIKTLVTMVSSAFGLVAALAWNETISRTINKFLKPGENILSWLIYALLVTSLAVLVGFYLSRLSAKHKEEEDEK